MKTNSKTLLLALLLSLNTMLIFNSYAVPPEEECGEGPEKAATFLGTRFFGGEEFGYWCCRCDGMGYKFCEKANIFTSCLEEMVDVNENVFAYENYTPGVCKSYGENVWAKCLYELDNWYRASECATYYSNCAETK